MAVLTEPGFSQFEQIVAVLVKHEVEFVVIGGQAEALMGSPRITYDTDICYRRTKENLARMVLALKELEVSLRNALPGLPFILDARTLSLGSNFTFDSKAGAIDILGFVEPIGDFEEVTAHAEHFAQPGFSVRTIGLEDLIRVKQHLGRGKDRESLFQLLAIREHRARKTGGGV